MEKLQTKQNSCSGGGVPGYGHAGGGELGLAGWPEARPTSSGYSNIPLVESNDGLFNGSTCGIMHHSLLSPSFQSSIGLGAGMPII